MVDRPQHVAEGFAVADHAADRDAAKSHAVIAAFTPDQDAPRAFAADAVIGECDFQRGIDGFGSGVGKEHPVHALRRDRGEFFRRLECDRVMHLKAGRVIHGLGLLFDRVHDRAAAVAGIDRPQAGNAVEHLAAVLGLVIHVLGGHQQAGCGFELAVGGEGDPQRIEVQ